jgi:trigger factor
VKSVLIEKEECRRELEIEIPVEDWSKEAEKVAQEFAKVARVPGFRPGRVPITVIKQRFRQEIRAELLKDMLPKVIEEATKEKNITLITQPEVKDLVFENDKPITFKADFEILPTLALENYKGLKAEEEAVVVTEEDIEGTLKHLREQAAEFLVVENRPVENGDFVSVAFTAYPTRASDQKPEKEFDASDILIEVGGERTVKEFTENLMGKSAGDEVQFTVDYADDFADKRLAGRHVSYQVKVETLKTKSLPEINDDFAKTLGEFDTLAELKDKIHKDTEQAHKRQAKERTCDKLVDLILEHNPFAVPKALVESQIDSRLQSMFRSLYQQGINPKKLSIDWEKLREEHRTSAIREAKVTLALEHIAKTENISTSDEEVDAEITKMAEKMQQPFSSIKQHLTKEGTLDKLRSQLTNQKTLNFLYESADISIGPTQLDKQETSS